MRWFGPIFGLICLAVLIAGVYWQSKQESPFESTVSTSNIRLVLRNEKADIGNSSAIAQAPVRLVNVFASWCTPCIAELPYLKRLSAQTSLPLVGIAWRDHKAKLEPWLGAHGNPFDVIYLDPDGLLLGKIELSGVPETWLVDKAGRVKWRHRGVITQDNYDEIESDIRETARGLEQ